MAQFIKATAPNTTTVVTKANRQYVLEENDTYYTQRFGSKSLHYQIKNLRFAYSLLNKPRTILDVGMNVGMNTVEYATFAKRVVGFEPTPWVYKWATQNIQHNTNVVDTTAPRVLEGVDKHLTAQIETHQIGLSDQAQKAVKFFSHPRNNGHNSIAYTKRFKDTTVVRQFEADISTIDGFAYTDVDFIKIDTEGFELPVLRGGIKTIQQCRPVIQSEIVPAQCRRANYTALDIWDLLVTQLNYRVYTVDGVERTRGMTIEKNKLLHNGEKPRKMMDYFFVPQEVA